MADLCLQDSGYLSPTNTGTRASSGNMVNAGAVINLHGVEFKPKTSANFDTSPTLGVYGTGTNTGGGATIHLASIENMGFTIMGVLDLSNATDKALVVPITQLPKTKWYKLLYFDSADTEQLIYQLADDTFTAGERTAFSLSGAWLHLHVMIKSVQWVSNAKSHPKATYNITGFVTKGETSTI